MWASQLDLEVSLECSVGPGPGTGTPPDSLFSLGGQKGCSKCELERVILSQKTLHGAAHHAQGRGKTGRWRGQASAPGQDGRHSKTVLSLVTKS